MIDCDREEKKKKDDCGCNGRKIFPKVIAAFVRLQNCHGQSVLGTEDVGVSQSRKVVPASRWSLSTTYVLSLEAARL